MAMERESRGLPNFYYIYDIPYNASIEEIKKILDKKEAEVLIEEQKLDISLAREYLLHPSYKKAYDAYLERHNFIPSQYKKQKPDTKKTVFKIVRNTIIAGVLVAIGVSGTLYFQRKKQENLNNNVLVQYEAQYGDTLNGLTEDFYDFTFIHRETVIGGRQYELYEGDEVIGRTTPERAEYLQKRGGEIISYEEAKEILGEETHKGVLNSEVNFYNPNGKQLS